MSWNYQRACKGAKCLRLMLQAIYLRFVSSPPVTLSTLSNTDQGFLSQWRKMPILHKLKWCCVPRQRSGSYFGSLCQNSLLSFHQRDSCRAWRLHQHKLLDLSSRSKGRKLSLLPIGGALLCPWDPSSESSSLLPCFYSKCKDWTPSACFCSQRWEQILWSCWCLS